MAKRLIRIIIVFGVLLFCVSVAGYIQPITRTIIAVVTEGYNPFSRPPKLVRDMPNTPSGGGWTEASKRFRSHVEEVASEYDVITFSNELKEQGFLVSENTARFVLTKLLCETNWYIAWLPDVEVLVITDARVSWYCL